ncbi:hypothetical protein Vadar_022326 [Vaccinium darrowii]|uniref:Uncharacterized protein n=1 Tax=Vaccinium darrowii TaxID=229202 RepID=A0ACB7YNM5_9ERIC|nr:hypothetical protein Vadar_022326 [Vaccinium darrowii]
MLAGKSVHHWAQRCTAAVRALRAFSCPCNKNHGDNVVGIDFGTTNSRLAIMEAQVPTLLETESGKAIPSFIAIDDKMKFWVGEVAKAHAIGYPAEGFCYVKTLLGRKYHDLEIEELRTKVPYAIIEGPNGEAWVKAHGEPLSPTKLCAIIITKLKKLAECHRLRSISKAVIAAPAHFSGVQREEMLLAAKTAGLDVLGIIDEPIAVALSCKNIDRGIIAVFSLGGGTFSITLLEVSDGDTIVKATDFDTSLGGDNFDLVLVEYLVEEIRRIYSVDVSGDRIAMMKLNEAAVKAKVELSSSDQALIKLSSFAFSEDGPVHAKIALSRSKFEELVEPLIERMKKLCQKCLEAAHLDVQEIDEVVTVGGMVRVPRIKMIVEEIFLKSPCMQPVGPEEAVAIGALLKGALIIEDRRKLSMDLVPLSLGLEMLGGRFARIIDRDSVIPCVGSRNFTTSLDYEDSVSIRIFQGEHKLASRNKLLGELKLNCIPRAPQGVITIKVSFAVDTDGVLTVLGKSKDEYLQASLEIPFLNETNEEYVKKMARNAILVARRDREKFLMMQLKSVFEYKINRIHKILNYLKKTIPDKHLVYYENALVDMKKAVDFASVDSLKTMVSEATWRGYQLTKMEPEFFDSDSDEEI